jgi:hypothetical protein
VHGSFGVKTLCHGTFGVKTLCNINVLGVEGNFWRREMK